MKQNNCLKQERAQNAIEYMLVLMVVAAIVLIGFKQYLPITYNASNRYFNRVVIGIMGDPNPCGDGVCHPIFEFRDKENKCPKDCCPPSGICP
ncbi:hypothetical protein MNBD_UNCLBAC01-1678 [hydrothermal vent metagenome]|uniref:Uncharacterized protein n=1 Tax=hydrothermal vent metagenome TaxID=652676 RepID=A0A3B1DP17_9ZZZZ